MSLSETHTIIISILVPMLAGFGWIIHQIRGLDRKISNIETRLTIVETILSMCGVPINSMLKLKNRNNEDVV